LIDFRGLPLTLLRFSQWRDAFERSDFTKVKQLTINASTRNNGGSAHSGRLRRDGKVPAVAYGKTREPSMLSVDASDLRVLLKSIGNNAPIVQLIEDDSKPRTSIIQEVQRHAIKDTYIHVDFRQVADDEVVVLDIPVHPFGLATGVKNDGGTLETVAHTVSVRCLPKNIPDFVEVDVTELAISDLIHIKELPALEGVEYLDHAEQPVFTVIM
jgi:large subunit ribosomal protein L25